MYANQAVRVSTLAETLDHHAFSIKLPTATVNRDLSLNLCGFETLTEGLDYAADGETGFNYYSVRGELRQALSYAELREDSISLARKLLRLGLPEGARVALVAETNADFHRLFFACQYATLVPVQLPTPINLGAKDSYVRQLRRMIEASDPTLAVASETMIEILREATAGLGKIGRASCRERV
jgi:fatty-acyl-CoA synthase